MARLALAVGGGIAGFLIGGPIGAEIGMTIGGILGSALFPGQLPDGPRLQDLHISSATDGAPIPFGYNTNRVAGNLIWTSGIKEVVTNTSQGGGKGTGPKQKNFTYFADIACSFGEGQASLGRVWFDSKIVYNPAQAYVAITTAIGLPGEIIVNTAASLTVKTNSQVTITGTTNTTPGGPSFDQVTSVISVTGPNSFIVKDQNGVGFGSAATGGTVGLTASGGQVITSLSMVGDLVTAVCGLNPEVGSQVLIIDIPASFHGNAYAGYFTVAQSAPTFFTYYNPSSPNLFPISGTFVGFAVPALPQYAPPTSFYPGTETQNADPIIQAAEGAANTPAMRGLAYAVWQNFPLVNFGNRIPNIRAEVTYLPPQPLFSPFVQENVGGAADGFAFNVAFNNPVTAGNTVYVTVMAQNIGNNQQTANISDNQGNVYSLVVFSGAVDNNEYWTSTYIAKVKSSGSLTVSVSWNTGGGGPGFGFGFIMELLGNWSGGGSGVAKLATSGPFPAMSATLDGDSHTIVITAANNGDVSLTAPFANKLLSSQNGISWAQNPVLSNGAVQWGGSFNNSNIRFTGTTVVLTNPVLRDTFNLQGMVLDLCERSGLAASQVDVSNLVVQGTSVPLTGPTGYVISRPTTGQDAIRPLAQGFFFDGMESGGELRFVQRGNTIDTLTIPEADLGLVKDNRKIEESISMAQDLPREIMVMFNDPALGYQQNKQHKRRHTRIVKTKNQQIFEFPFTIDSTTARQIAEKTLFTDWVERKPYSFNVWKALYMLLDPTDIVQFTYEGLLFQARVVKTQIGVDFKVELTTVNELVSTYTSTVAGSSASGTVTPISKTIPNTVLFLLDTTLMLDSQANPANPGTGYYAALSTTDTVNWTGASLEKSTDNINFTQVDTDSTAADYGVTLNLLPAPRSPWVWDTVSQLNIRMAVGALTGNTDINVLNGQNALLVGSAANGWELIQFANAAQNADGSYTVSRLLRGRRGTDVFCGTHTSADTVIALNTGGVLHELTGIGELNLQRFFLGLTFGATIPTPVVSTPFTNTGRDLMPYAVTSVAGARDLSGNLAVTWIRRTRIGGDWLENVGTVPLSETAESYDVDVMGGPGSASVIRTFSALPSPAVTYTAAQQVADFGRTLPNVTLNIYQNSSVVGRGFKKSVTL